MDRDPLARVIALGESENRRMTASMAVSIALYACVISYRLWTTTGLGGFASAVHHALGRIELKIDIEPPPPPPPPEPEKPEPVHEEPPPPKAAAAPPPPPPAAAQAGKVLTADPDPDEPIDLTGNTFVQGTADAYAGGITASTGKSETAVHDARAAATGTGTSAPPPPPTPTVDRSSPARPVSGSWNHCGFPAEADMEQVNAAKATIAVTIGSDGHAQRVSVVQDPGYGFGALAKRCAMQERFEPARGKDGSAITATQVITINFRR